jgi:cyclic pyranopterin phosphate synthase
MRDHHEATLTHVDAHGRAAMVDVAAKPERARRAVASATIRTTVAVIETIVDRAAPKGDVVAVSRIAGIQAAKRTSELVPLAHQVPLSSVDVRIALDALDGTATVEAEARTVAATGVEIEAMIAASIASVTFYDMVKAMDRGAVIEDVRVIAKSGGASGSFELDPSSGTLEPTLEDQP